MNNNDNKFRAGIVSVTFRQYEYKNLIRYIKATDLSCVEWGSDIHVPYDNSHKAVDVAVEMQKNNLVSASYGSYYRLGNSDNTPEMFSMILNNAKILGVPMIRVWGGTTGSSNLDEKDKQDIIKDVLNIAGTAKKENIKISLEYHANTITDTIESTIKFIKEVRKQENGDNVYLYWQPNQNRDFFTNKAELMLVCPYLSNVHVFAWETENRFALDFHREHWENYINIIKNNSGKNHDFLLEFVKDDLVEQMTEDAKVLVELINK